MILVKIDNLRDAEVEPQHNGHNSGSRKLSLHQLFQPNQSRLNHETICT